jgi:hypothetical protein
VRSLSTILACVLLVGCRPAIAPPKTSANGNVPNASSAGALQTPRRPAPSPHTAIAVTRRGLVLIDAEFGTQNVLAQIHPGWCAYDPGNDLIWALNNQDRLELLTISLQGVRSTLVTFPPEATMPPPDSVEVAYGTGKTLGGLSLFSALPELRIDLLSKRTVGVDSCDGDKVWYCSETSNPNEQSAESAPFERLPSFKTQLAALSLGTFVDGGQVEQLIPAIRSSVRTPSEPIRKLPIECHTKGDRGECGSGFTLSPSPYWAVKTAEVQGDFFHELYHLYDPHMRRYFLPSSPKDKSQLPTEMSDWEPRDVRISPDGRWMLENDRIVGLEGGLPIVLEAACGWLDEEVRQ